MCGERLGGQQTMKTFILAVVCLGIMSAQSFAAEPPRIGQVYWWDSDTPFGYGGVVPKTALTVIELYGSGVKLKDANGNEYKISNSMFSQYVGGLQMLVTYDPAKKRADDRAAAKVQAAKAKAARDKTINEKPWPESR
jgi:hypothetical protein